jgi:flavin reductase (DIM6/NTAB) family NADH-FMN oxidoreductase RutF
MQIDFTAISPQLRYKLLSSTVTPRPIAWVSTLNADGTRPNAAPFSLFNMFGEDPPIVAFSILSRSMEDRKDTGNNVRRHGEFVVNLVSEDNLDRMNITAIDFEPGTSEFDEAGLTPLPSLKIRTPRIAESHVAFECRLVQIVELGKMRSMIIGEVLAMHIRDEAVIDVDRGYIDTTSLRIIGRGGPNSYVRTTEVVKLSVPPLEKWRADRSNAPEAHSPPT